MGSITRFNLQKLTEDFNIPVFFETGTWKGDALAAVLSYPFKKIYSVEIVPELAGQARIRFENESRVRIFEGSSSEVFTNQLGRIKGNCLFWLDAHYPGADAGLQHYDEKGEENLRLPLETELELIRELRPGKKDLIIIDDLRIYEDGPYEKGNAPADTLPKNSRNLDFIDKGFSTTHDIHRSYLDEGYLILVPKSRTSSNKRLINDYILPTDQVCFQ